MDYSKKTAPVRTADGGVVIGLSYASVKKLSLYHICRRSGFFQRIAVNVCGDADGGVAEGLGYGLEGDIHIDQRSCVGVPEIVKANRGQIQLAQQCFEPLVHQVGLYRCAVRVTGDEVVILIFGTQ